MRNGSDHAFYPPWLLVDVLLFRAPFPLRRQLYAEAPVVGYSAAVWRGSGRDLTCSGSFNQLV